MKTSNASKVIRKSKKKSSGHIYFNLLECCFHRHAVTVPFTKTKGILFIIFLPGNSGSGNISIAKYNTPVMLTFICIYKTKLELRTRTRQH